MYFILIGFEPRDRKDQPPCLTVGVIDCPCGWIFFVILDSDIGENCAAALSFKTTYTILKAAGDGDLKDGLCTRNARCVRVMGFHALIALGKGKPYHGHSRSGVCDILRNKVSISPQRNDVRLKHRQQLPAVGRERLGDGL